jgi:hypothetical protein
MGFQYVQRSGTAVPAVTCGRPAVPHRQGYARSVSESMSQKVDSQGIDTRQGFDRGRGGAFPLKKNICNTSYPSLLGVKTLTPACPRNRTLTMGKGYAILAYVDLPDRRKSLARSHFRPAEHMGSL